MGPLKAAPVSPLRPTKRCLAVGAAPPTVISPTQRPNHRAAIRMESRTFALIKNEPNGRLRLVRGTQRYG